MSVERAHAKDTVEEVTVTVCKFVGTLGAATSIFTVTGTPTVVELLPMASNAVALHVWAPLVAPVMGQLYS